MQRTLTWDGRITRAQKSPAIFSYNRGLLLINGREWSYGEFTEKWILVGERWLIVVDGDFCCVAQEIDLVDFVVLDVKPGTGS